MINNLPESKRILITGGAGFLGKHLISKLYKKNDLIIFSRDEAKHYELKSIYPEITFIVGDIRNKELLTRISRGVNYDIYAASLKQISACDENPEEAVQTIILGAINSKYAAIENKFEAATFISTDKSRAATTIYGSLKFAAGEQFIIKNSYEKISSTRLSTVIYGNVLNSTGSIIPLIWRAIKTDSFITLFSKDMTRFLLDVEEATDLIFKSLMIDGACVIPKAKSARIFDLFEIYKDKFGLKYKIGEPRLGEKTHEILSSREEINRLELSKCKSFFILKPRQSKDSNFFYKGEEYNSKNNPISRRELENLLSKFSFFMPS